MNTSFAITGNTEILQIADAVAREKGVLKDSVIEAIAKALQNVAKKKYGPEQNIRVVIDRKSGHISLFRDMVVVEVIEDPATQISEKDSRLKVGEIFSEELPPIDFGRVTAQAAKQVIIQEVRDAERDRQYEEFKNRTGEIASGIVKRVEYGGHLVIDLGGRAEAILRRDEMIPREMFRQNDRVRCYIMDVRREKRGPQILLSRTHPQFLAKLFAQEVPEIYDGVINIMGVARDPGSRAKVAVHSNDSSIDPLSSCIGVRGVRVKAIVEELQGEKIDIVKWSPDPATFVVNALTTAEVTKIVLDEENRRVEIVVPDDQLSLAIGRRGQNVRLASQLIGWNIDVLTEEEESRRRNEETKALSQLFIDGLNVEEVIAHLLVAEGFRSMEDIAYVPIEDLASIQGFDETVAQELKTRANDYMEKRAKELEEKIKSLGIDESLKSMPEMNPEILVKLGSAGIKSSDDLAELSRDEFIEIVPELAKNTEQVNGWIMKAREKWFGTEENKEV